MTFTVWTKKIFFVQQTNESHGKSGWNDIEGSLLGELCPFKTKQRPLSKQMRKKISGTLNKAKQILYD